jgi:aconitate hydratase
MAPEYGATIGFFPVDSQTLDYMRLSGRSEGLIKTVEDYCKANMLWRDDAADIAYTAVVDVDLSTIVPSLAGPARPQDRVQLTDMKSAWHKELPKFLEKGASSAAKPAAGGAGGTATLAAPSKVAVRDEEGHEYQLTHGDVVIAAITSCTNTSNPNVMIGAGLVAKKAAEKGLTRKPWVKTSLAPGSKVVTDYLVKGGLMKPLEDVGFFLVGYGCTTCIGNSGPLPDHIGKAIKDGDLVVASVLSGNRNFEARVHQDVKAPSRAPWTSTLPPSRWGRARTASPSTSRTSGPRRRKWTTRWPSSSRASSSRTSTPTSSTAAPSGRRSTPPRARCTAGTPRAPTSRTPRTSRG